MPKIKLRNTYTWLNRRLKTCLCLITITVTSGTVELWGQSPHGEGFKMDCAQCHSPEGWSFVQKTGGFDHKTTGFELSGQHIDVNCRSCHGDLVFEKAEPNCFSCHEDVHAQTVGQDCARCHNPDSWVVSNITEIHEQVNFPLVGSHSTMDCAACHENQTTLRFTPLPIDCFGCHARDYTSAVTPNHIAENYPNSCESCHSVLVNGWSSMGVNHQFFPLAEGHSNLDCFACHIQGRYTGLSSDCFSCHQHDFELAKNPDHQGFPRNCSECHTLSPSWQPARFDAHDAVFPIYSGNHKNEWNQCTDCHNQPNNFIAFSCIDCHEHNDPNDLAGEHDDVRNYRFESQACYQCHPDGGD